MAISRRRRSPCDPAQSAPPPDIFRHKRDFPPALIENGVLFGARVRVPRSKVLVQIALTLRHRYPQPFAISSAAISSLSL